MSQSISSEQTMVGRNPSGHRHRIVASQTWDWIVAPPKVSCLSREARTRLSWCRWHQEHGRNVSLTCRHFGISRPTFYRWYGRLTERGVVGLEKRSHRPHTVRQRSWTGPQATAVLTTRQQYPGWGKAKVQILLAGQGVDMSVSMVGRILDALKARGELREPPKRIRQRGRSCARPWAIRSSRRDRIALWPGDLAQVDTKDVRFSSGRCFKHLSLVDVVSRYSAAELGRNATARTMTEHLDRILSRLPFMVAAIQIDGGSEFKAEFEAYCQQHGIVLYVLPPYSPKLNGCVERLQRTYAEEFYRHCDAEPTLEHLRPALAAFETCYNTVRPHQALGYLTPQQFLDTRKVDA